MQSMFHNAFIFYVHLVHINYTKITEILSEQFHYKRLTCVLQINKNKNMNIASKMYVLIRSTLSMVFKFVPRSI